MLNTERVSPPSLEEGGTVDIKVTSVSKRAQENEKAGLLRSLFLAFVHQSPTHDDATCPSCCLFSGIGLDASGTHFPLSLATTSLTKGGMKSKSARSKKALLFFGCFACCLCIWWLFATKNLLVCVCWLHASFILLLVHFIFNQYTKLL